MYRKIRILKFNHGITGLITFIKEDAKTAVSRIDAKHNKGYYVFNKQFFVFHPSFYVTDSIFLTLYLVSAYTNVDILYNEVVKSKEVVKMNIKKENLAYGIEIERGDGII
ncbi:hypothetical protein [Bacillus cereus group sp. BfR-BA-01383]|uniref:hypothetical protein n=1 Tax=Bacillus cereus group sp. BfR-BA-01383 TaxID=2920327 RepID=UPI001F590993|nr:hypothetical protein [Bacillus cereus group sp. BfR-BA-01383]